MVFRREPDCSPILLRLNSTRPALPAWWCLTFARRVRVSAGDNAANVEGVDCCSQSKQHSACCPLRREGEHPRADHGMERRTETRRTEATGSSPKWLLLGSAVVARSFLPLLYAASSHTQAGRCLSASRCPSASRCLSDLHDGA